VRVNSDWLDKVNTTALYTTSSADGCAFLKPFIPCTMMVLHPQERGVHQSSYIGRICKAGILKSMPRRLPYCFVVAFLSSVLQHGRHRSSNRLCCCCRTYTLSFSRFLSGMAFSPQILLHISLRRIASPSSLSRLSFIIDLPRRKTAK